MISLLSLLSLLSHLYSFPLMMQHATRPLFERSCLGRRPQAIWPQTEQTQPHPLTSLLRYKSCITSWSKICCCFRGIWRLERWQEICQLSHVTQGKSGSIGRDGGSSQSFHFSQWSSVPSGTPLAPLLSPQRRYLGNIFGGIWDQVFGWTDSTIALFTLWGCLDYAIWFLPSALLLSRSLRYSVVKNLSKLELYFLNSLSINCSRLQHLSACWPVLVFDVCLFWFLRWNHLSQPFVMQVWESHSVIHCMIYFCSKP